MEQRLNDFLYNIIDDVTGDWSMYRKVDRWLDGTPITNENVAQVCDGVLYRQFASQPDEVFARVLVDNEVRWAWYNPVADGTTDTAESLQSLLDYFPVGHHYRLRLPNGTFRLNQQVVFRDRVVQVTGSGNTVLVTPRGVSGFFITRSTGIQFSSFANFRLRTVSPEYTDGKNGTSEDPDDYLVCGITCEAVSFFEDVEVENFSHNFKFQGDVLKKTAAAPFGTDSSSSSLLRCRSYAAYCNGFWMRGDKADGLTSGNDANVINFYNCVARDAEGVGFHDQSFLGNMFYGCQGDSNKRGHFRVDGVAAQNSRACFYGCYGESGNGYNPVTGERDGTSYPSHLEGKATLSGGIHSNGITHSLNFGGFIQTEGAEMNQILVGAITLRQPGELGFQGPGLDSTRLLLKNVSPVTNRSHFGMRGVGEEADFWQIFQENSIVRGLPIKGSGTYLRAPLINSQRIHEVGDVTDVTQGKLAETDFRRGDLLKNGNLRPWRVEQWECIQAGRVNNPPYTQDAPTQDAPPVPARTGTSGANDGGGLRLSGPSTVLVPGVAITVNGQSAVITGKDPNDSTLLFLDTQLTQFTTPSAITFAQPVFRSSGRMGSGAAAQRPTLRAVDRWQFFNEDSQKLEVWNGTTWLPFP